MTICCNTLCNSLPQSLKNMYLLLVILSFSLLLFNLFSDTYIIVDGVILWHYEGNL